MVAFAPTTSQKVLALDEHVHYEIEQFVIGIACMFGKVANQYSENVLVEATLVHTRILLDFFQTKEAKRFKDDVLAADYDFPVSPVGIPKADEDRLNKEVAHLTYSRLKVKDKRWNWEVIAPPMLERIAEFIEALPRGRWRPAHHEKWVALQDVVRATKNLLSSVGGNP
jgi:hypothetical protein